MAANLKKPFGLIWTSAFGRNSAVMSTNNVDRMVWINRIKPSLVIPHDAITGFNKVAAEIPNNTNATLLPNNNMAIKWD